MISVAPIDGVGTHHDQYQHNGGSNMAQALPEWNDAYFLPLVFPLLQPLSDVAQSLLRVEFSLLIMVQHEVFQLFLLVVGFHIADGFYFQFRVI